MVVGSNCAIVSIVGPYLFTSPLCASLSLALFPAVCFLLGLSLVRSLSLSAASTVGPTLAWLGAMRA